ncbi:arrestin domain-containing protein 1-like [Gigaspora margarita]|uniref:Arrestin domain-containing protein 1-like n=1 Tax=Gigaspora margarita TaxID=4874 RepID=A0A8H4A2E2_GIGMA|nr:arrestin domain-containing protein 1-like [Gigaspora margarita]
MSSQRKLRGAVAASLMDFDSNIPYHTFLRNLKLLQTGQIIVDFEIILEKNRVIFHGPPTSNKSRTVRGKVKLEVAGKLNVKEIMLTLTGDFKFCKTNNGSTINDTTIPRQGTVFSTCILLVNKRTLYPGLHEFFFEFLIPGDLPESISSDHVLCEYFLKADLTPRETDELNSLNKVVDIVDIFVERTMLLNDEYITRGLEAKRYIGSKKNVLDFEFIVPKIIRLNTDALRFHARWDGLRVANVTFSFVQSECLKASLPETDIEDSSPPTVIDSATKIISGPFRFDLPRNERLKLQCRPMVFQLPIIEPFVHDYDLYGIEIRHHLIISIQLANRRKDIISFAVPIVVESIVPNLDSSPSPCKVCQTTQSALLHFANKIFHGHLLETKNKNLSTKDKDSITKDSENLSNNQPHDQPSSQTPDNNEEKVQRIVPSRSSSIQYINRNSTINNSSNHDNDHHVNFKSSISTITESDDDETDKFSSEKTGTTTATTATYINPENTQQAFPQKVSSKPLLPTASGNIVADKFAKLQYILQQRRSRRRSMTVKNRSSSSASIVKFAPTEIFDIIANGHNPTLETTTLTA